MDALPLVSVAIPTKNSSVTLAATLDSLRKQTYRRVEIVIVDGGSSDGTLQMAETHGCRVVTGHFAERSSQLNAAIQIASGKYFYRVDADFLVEPKVIEEAVASCEQGDSDAVLIHNASDPTRSLWAKVRRFERDMYRDDELNVAARFVRTDLLRRLGGFDEDLVAGEDYDLHRRLVQAKARVGRISSEELHVGEPRTLREVWDKHFYYGRTSAKYLGKYKTFAFRQLSPVRPAMIRHWRDFIDNPGLSLVFIAYLIVKYSAGVSGLLAGFARRPSGSRQMTTRPRNPSPE